MNDAAEAFSVAAAASGAQRIASELLRAHPLGIGLNALGADRQLEGWKSNPAASCSSDAA
jgi:hypothetical protein